MENNYQEAIKELKDFVHSELDGTRMLDGYLKHCDTLQELVEQNKEYTLEEIKKMWEDLGYEYKKIFCIQIINEEKGTEIYLFEEDKEYSVEGYLNFQEHQLLTKTFKALKKERK